MQTRDSSLSIPHDDWDRAPWNRRTFQRVREFVATTRVRRSPHPQPWPVGLEDIASIQFESEGHRQNVDAFLGSSYTDGFLVVHRGAIVAEQYENGMMQFTPHLAQSISKSVVGTLAGILAGQGRLRTDARLTEYVPELEATAYRGATVQHVLDMSSGVFWDENYTSPHSHVAQMDAACGWKRVPVQGWPTCMWDLVLTLRDSRGPHGVDFSYRSIETDVLAFAIERATGERLAELVSNEIWAPMGAEEDAYFTVDPTGFACACGGFNATLRDFARFAQLFVSGGTAAGRQIIPLEFINGTRGADSRKFSSSYRDVLPRGAYRNQFWIEDGKRRALLARGVFGQLIYVDPDAQFVGVKLSSWPEFTDVPRTRTALAAMQAIRDSLT